MDAIPYLNWGDARHFDRFQDRPCCLCGKPTPMRSHADEPVHKVCAEEWNATHPGEARLYTLPDKHRPDRPQHDVGTWRFHNDGPTTSILLRRAPAAVPQDHGQTSGDDFTLFAA